MSACSACLVRLVAALGMAVALTGVLDVSTAVATVAGCPPKPTAVAPSQSSEAQRELVPSGAVSVTLCRYRGLNDPTPRYVSQLVGSATLTSGWRARSLGDRFDALPPLQGGTTACPSDDGSALLVIFAYPRSIRDPVSVHPTGCSYATNGSITADMAVDAGQRLRTELQRMTGCNSSRDNWLCNSDPTPSSRRVKVPRVIGLEPAAAYQQLHHSSLRVSLPAVELDYVEGPSLYVVAESPRAGQSVPRGGIVRLTLGCPRCGAGSPGVPTFLPTYRVPDFVGARAGAARRWTTQNQLDFVAHLGPLTAGDSANLFDNYRVLRQQPRAGSSLKLGTGSSCCGGTQGSFTPTPLIVWGAEIKRH